jgi:hypothetical protein
MNLESRVGGLAALASLRRFARPRANVEHCELCSAELPAEHPHLVELSARRLYCACEPCAILFDRQGAATYRRVPRDSYFLADFRLSDVVWQGVGLPIELAFFMNNSSTGRITALYPSPAGAIESLPPPDAWQTLVEDNPVLTKLEPDVEALLVNRLGAAPECYRVGIDKCYELVGLLRTHWRGLSGGTAVWEEIHRFFTALKARSHVTGDPAHA